MCRSLGLPDAASATTLANFGRGSGEIWLDGVQCFGTEMSLADCKHDGWGRHNCGHGEDAGVVCGQPEGKQNTTAKMMMMMMLMKMVMLLLLMIMIMDDSLMKMLIVMLMMNMIVMMTMMVI